MYDDNLFVRLRGFRPDTEGQADAHRPETAGIQPMAGRESRHGLTAEVQNFLAINTQNAVAVDEIANFLAKPQGWTGRDGFESTFSAASSFSEL